MKRRRRLLLFLVLAVLAVGHYLYWYAPRERAAVPDPAGLPQRLMGSGAYEACLWVPYPHQNVGALGESIDDGAAWLAAAARLAAVPPPVLPSFGPFALPPSHEIAACSDLDGRRYRAAARVYPGLALVARLAGRLAGNPWLAGGEVSEVEGGGDEVIERRVRVEWRGGTWILTAGAEPEPAQPAPAPPSGAAEEPRLGMLRLGREASEFPPGLYRLRRRAGDLELALDSRGDEPAFAELDLRSFGGQGGSGAPALLALAGPSWPAESPRPLPPAALVLYDTRDGLRLGGLGEMPGAAVFHPRGAERWHLPGQSVVGLLSRALPQGNAAGWHIVALDTASLRRARAIAPRLAKLVPPDATGTVGPGGRLILGLWFQPRPTLALVGRTRRVLQKVPLVDRRQIRRWRDGETVLEPLAACAQVSLAATETPASFRLRFHGCGT
jgi:hypothetical protein